MRTCSQASEAVFVASALTMALALTGVYIVFVRTLPGQRIDELAFDGAKLGQRTLAPVTLSLLDALPTVALGMAAILAIIITIVRRNWFVLGIGIGAALGANVSTQFIKALLIRPDVGVDGYAFNSLPSGHTTVAASAALVVFLVSSRRTRPAVAFTGTVFTVAAGVATLANQWHRPSDVLAGLIVVAFWGCIAGAIIVHRQPLEASPADRFGMAALLWIALPCMALAGVALLLSYFEVKGSFAHFVAYAGGASAVAATGFLLAGAATRVFRPLR